MTIDLERVAPFSSGWSLGADGYELLREDLAELRPEAIVEFGAGTSTIHLSQDFPQSRIWTHEGYPDFAHQTRQTIADLDAADRVTVTHAPLGWQVHQGALFYSYTQLRLPVHADAILIDGPPYWTRRGREACLYQAHAVLRVGGRVYLDDYRRPSEARIVANWLGAFRGAFVRRGVLESDHRICVLEKVAPSTNPRISPLHMLETAYQASRYVYSRLRGNVPR